MHGRHSYCLAPFAPNRPNALLPAPLCVDWRPDPQTEHTHSRPVIIPTNCCHLFHLSRHRRGRTAQSHRLPLPAPTVTIGRGLSTSSVHAHLACSLLCQHSWNAMGSLDSIVTSSLTSRVPEIFRGRALGLSGVSLITNSPYYNPTALSFLVANPHLFPITF